MSAHDDLTDLLHAWSDGDREAAERVFTLLYSELRRRAVGHLRRERDGHTLQPTALIHEAYLRLARQDRAIWRNRAQFLAVASQMMRRILVDRARARQMAKRSGRWTRVAIDDLPGTFAATEVDVLALDEALAKLATFDPRKCRIAELRFFGGLTAEEISEVLGTSVATIERDWKAARAWLFRMLSSPSRR